MEKRNIKKIDLKDKLMYEMRKRNFIQKSEVASVINYLLNKDVVSTFGKTEFETCTDRDFVDEIEITRIGDGLFITTIDGKYYQVQFRENGMDVYVVRTEDGKVNEISDTERVFDITFGQDNVINNLITYNEDETYEKPYKRSKKETMVAFFDMLKKRRINVQLRREQGGDIDAACGQLRSKHMK